MSTTERTKQRQPCGCGCGQVAYWNRLRLMRGPDNHSYFILDGCRAAFAHELDAKAKLQEIYTTMKGFAFWRRWPFARMVQALNYMILQRRFGHDEARRHARRQAVLFCLPNAVTRRLMRLWK